MNIEYLRLFVRVASTQNISAAGKELGLSPAVASAHLNKLEESLNVRLIHRTTRSVALTQEGIAFLPHAEDVLAQVESARASVGAGSRSPSGTIRIAAPASFGRMHIVPLINEFMVRHPQLILDLRLSDTMIDLVEGGFDVAIRNAKLIDSTLVAKKLANDFRVVCASPSYLERVGTPSTPEELTSYDCIHLNGIDAWSFATPNGVTTVKTNARLKLDNGEALRDAAAFGNGITISSYWSIYEYLKTGKLVQILKDYPLITDTAIWAVYPSSRMLAPKVRVFIDFLLEKYGDRPYWEMSQH